MKLRFTGADATTVRHCMALRSKLGLHPPVLEREGGACEIDFPGIAIPDTPDDIVRLGALDAIHAEIARLEAVIESRREAARPN